jgi:hypothetical protein
VQLLPLSQRDIATILRWNMGRDANWLYQWAGKGWPLTAAQIAGKLAPESQVFRIDHDGEMIGTVELAGFTADSASICRFLIDSFMARARHRNGRTCNAVRSRFHDFEFETAGSAGVRFQCRSHGLLSQRRVY